MKYLIALILYIASPVYALECGQTESSSTTEEMVQDVKTVTPSYLKGASITITKADGSSETVSAEEFMVVKRAHKRPVTLQKTSSVSLACKANSTKNILSVKAVDGYSDVEKELTPSSATLKVERQVGLGVQYQHAISNKLYLGGGLDTNRGAEVLLGIGF